MRLVALIPAYEPGKELVDVSREASASGLEVLIVNDGSGREYDPIISEAAQYGTLLQYEKNRGKGHALKTGYRYILKNMPYDTVVVTMDCDGQHKVSDALLLARKCERKPSKCYLGSRTLPKSAPWKSKFGNAVTNIWFFLITHQRLLDTQTGLRAYHAQYLPLLLSIRSERYEYEIGTLLSTANAKIEIDEMPIETIYIDNNKSTHFKAVSDTARIWREMLRFSKTLILEIAGGVMILVSAVLLIRSLLRDLMK